MVKQIIVTQNDYGIKLETQFVDDKKNPLDITGYDVSVKIIYNDKTIDTISAGHKDSTNGIAYIVLEKKHLINAGLHTSVWSVVNKDEYVTAQENVYYFVKDVEGDVEGSEDDTPTIDLPIDIDANGVLNKFNEIDNNLFELTEQINVVNEEIDSINETLSVVNEQLDTKALQSDLEIEKNRINNLVAVKDSVDNLETADIRIGANGIIYESAGEAVRDQFLDGLNKFNGVSYSNLDEEMREIIGSKKTPYILTYKDGYYMNKNLVEIAFTTASYSEINNLKEGEYICINGIVKGSAIYAIIFVDSSNKVISKHFVGNDTVGIEYNSSVRVPKNAVKCYINNHGIGLVFSKYEIDTLPMTRLKDFNKISIYEEEQIITLSEENTELLLGKIYSQRGVFIENKSFSTLYYPVGKYNSFLLHKGGANGGAFVAYNKKWISSFATDGENASTKKEVPQGAYYIAISVATNNKYNTIKGYINRTTYNLNNLKLNEFNLSEVEKYIKTLNGKSEINQWKGKKIGILGTSVSFGRYSTKSYAMEIESKLGCTVKNFSVPGLALHTQENGDQLKYGSFVLSKTEYRDQGRTIPSSPIDYTVDGSYNDYYRTWENVFTSENKDIDLWVFAVAPNNKRFGLDDWNLFDKNNWKYSDETTFESHRTTFIGSILFIMDKMYKLNPNARMVFVLDSGLAHANGKSNFEVINTHWNIPIIDLWGKINISPKSLIKLKSKDGTDDHPSTFAHNIMGNIFTNELLLIS